MKSTRILGLVFGGMLIAAASVATAPVHAQTIVDEWSSVKMPPAPQLKRVTIDPKTTAFLALDFITQICDSGKPRCIASLPKVAKALDEARSHNVLVVYSMTPGHTVKDIQPQVAPKGDEPNVSFRADKFITTDLEKILKDHGITTVIVTGVASEGAVLYTASHAAFLGMKVIVPVDGSSSSNAFNEAAATWTLANAPGVGAQTTLTRFDMIDW
ncbi:MAG TPA: cysteine hydrolase [Beijerinckiaceae bacterium]|nr:cysteine hydrolase [Beijerinckiaceae bacterium]